MSTAGAKSVALVLMIDAVTRWDRIMKDVALDNNINATMAMAIIAHGNMNVEAHIKKGNRATAHARFREIDDAYDILINEGYLTKDPCI